MDRSWMYTRKVNGFLSSAFIEGVDSFVQFAISQPRWMDGTKIKCPCKLIKCQNRKFLEPEIVKTHLQSHGFVSNYYTWIFHGETNQMPADNRNIGVVHLSNASASELPEDEMNNAYTTMVHDLAGPEFIAEEDRGEPPNPDDKYFFDMLEASKRELCWKHKKESPPIRSGVDILRELDSLGLKKVTEPNAEAINKSIQKKTGCGWRKRSIFWDLPYWKTNLIRHNLDVMHIEKNVFENLIFTIMNVDGKTKDNPNSREELNDYCRRPELKRNAATGKYPQACYTLDKAANLKLCNWVNELKFPDGYVSNMGRCLDLQKLKLFSMKSHDCHVFMQRLIPIAFRELLPQNVWKALTELSLFFKDLTATVIGTDDMSRLDKDIAVILCKLERIFPPSFFDSMEHLPVHLAYEASIAGPVQYRWMYPFERYLRNLKLNVKNKSRIEGSIANAYLLEESSKFCSYYFEEHVSSKYRNVPRNDDEFVGSYLPRVSWVTS